MRKMFLDGELVGSSQQMISLTQAEYDNLSTEEKLNGDAYFINDSDEESDSANIKNIEYFLGDTSKLSTMADGTLSGILSDIYQRLGNLSFHVDEDGSLRADYDDTTPTPAVIPDYPEYASDATKIKYINDVIGDKTNVTNYGFASVTDMILDIYSRINGLVFSYNEVTDGIDVELVE